MGIFSKLSASHAQEVRDAEKEAYKQGVADGKEYNKNSIKRLEKQVDDIQETLEDTLDEHAEEIEDLNHKHERVVSRKNEEISDLEKVNTMLEGLVEDQQVLTKRSIELDTKETELQAIETASGNFDERIKKIKDEATAELDQRYQTGYADGVADGVRKVHEITSEDRKQAHQIALIAAASHTPSAVETLSAQIVEVAQKAISDGASNGNAKAKKSTK